MDDAAPFEAGMRGPQTTSVYQRRALPYDREFPFRDRRLQPPEFLECRCAVHPSGQGDAYDRGRFTRLDPPGPARA